MRGLKILVSTAALLAGLAMAPTAKAQISINIGVQPVCSYGYYSYSPYGCAPRGYYGSGYFYNGVFVGVGPWSGYGYSHGWGSHRFVNDGGGSYHGGVGHVNYHENQAAHGSHKGYSGYSQHGGDHEKSHPGNSGNHGGSDKSHHDKGHD